MEVLVEDTMQIDAEEFIFAVISTEYEEVTERTTTKPVTKPGKITSITQVRNIIKEMGIDTMTPVSYSFANRPYDVTIQDQIQLKFQNKQTLKLFFDRIKSIKNISGTLITTSSSKTEVYKKELYKKILQQASSQAEMIASLSSKKISSLLSVKEENTEDAGGGWVSYPPLSVIPGWHTTLSEGVTDKIILHKKITVRFAWQ